jgi:hypothetical protein
VRMEARISYITDGEREVRTVQRPTIAIAHPGETIQMYFRQCANASC